MLRLFPGLFLILLISFQSSACSTKSLKKTEQPQTAYLGILYTHSELGGVMIMEVFQDSPAEKAELNVGDIIYAVNGNAVAGVYTMKERIQAMKPGTEIILDVMKDRSTQQILKIRVKLDKIPEKLPPGRYYKE